MSTTPQPVESNEIDLGMISKKIGSFFEQLAVSLFNILFFIRRNILVFIVLALVGGGLGYYLDTKIKLYNHRIIVSPNYSSTDYLYAKVELLNSRILEGDTVFLKNIIGIKKPKSVTNIEIQPITDVYKFIENNTQNFELLRLFAEDGDLKKIVQENMTSKNYPFHQIMLTTKGATSREETVEPILTFLNDSDYFKKIQKEYLQNITVKMVENDSLIGQINGFLNGVSKSINGSQKSDKLVYYNENTQLNDVIKTKDELINEQGKLRIDLVTLDKIVKDNSVVLNILNKEGINGKMKLVLPLLFFFLFGFGALVIRSYKKRKTLLS